MGLAQINDGGFEAGIGAGTWTEASVNYGTPLCNAACGTCGGPCTPRTGTIYSWFGGSGSATELGSLIQNATIPTGTDVKLAMYVKMPGTGDGTAANYLRAFIDGNQVGELTALDSTAYTDYTLWAVDINTFANGSTHEVKIEGKENGTTVFNVLVDDVAITDNGQVIIGLFENEELAGINLYPTPANDQLTLAFNGFSGRATMTLYDLLGNVVSTQNLAETFKRTYTMDTHALANGAYVVSVVQGGKRFDQRVVIAH